MRHLFAAVLLLTALPAHAASWTVDVPASSLTFTGAQAGQPFTGRITRFTPTITLDPAKPETGRIDVLLDMASATIAEDAEQNQSLPTEDWFHTTAFPTAQFTSSSIRGTGAGQYAAEGTLTIRGKAKPVTLPFQLAEQADGTAIATGELVLDRRDFGLGGSEWADDKWIAYPVTVRFRLQATRA